MPFHVESLKTCWYAIDTTKNERNLKTDERIYERKNKEKVSNKSACGIISPSGPEYN